MATKSSGNYVRATDRFEAIRRFRAGEGQSTVILAAEIVHAERECIYRITEVKNKPTVEPDPYFHEVARVPHWVILNNKKIVDANKQTVYPTWHAAWLAHNIAGGDYIYPVKVVVGVNTYKATEVK
jgi:hypothetical protein